MNNIVSNKSRKVGNSPNWNHPLLRDFKDKNSNSVSTGGGENEMPVTATILERRLDHCVNNKNRIVVSGRDEEMQKPLKAIIVEEVEENEREIEVPVVAAIVSGRIENNVASKKRVAEESQEMPNGKKHRVEKGSNEMIAETKCDSSSTVNHYNVEGSVYNNCNINYGYPDFAYGNALSGSYNFGLTKDYSAVQNLDLEFSKYDSGNKDWIPSVQDYISNVELYNLYLTRILERNFLSNYNHYQKLEFCQNLYGAALKFRDYKNGIKIALAVIKLNSCNKTEKLSWFQKLITPCQSSRRYSIIHNTALDLLKLQNLSNGEKIDLYEHLFNSCEIMNDYQNAKKAALNLFNTVLREVEKRFWIIKFCEMCKKLKDWTSIIEGTKNTLGLEFTPIQSERLNKFIIEAKEMQIFEFNKNTGRIKELLDLSDACNKKGDYQKSILAINEALNIPGCTGSQQINLYGNLSFAYYHLKDFRGVKNAVLDVLKVPERMTITNVKKTVDFYIQLGLACNMLGEFNNAEAFAKRALNIAVCSETQRKRLQNIIDDATKRLKSVVEEKEASEILLSFKK